jgi:hypothetical protein
MEEMDAVRGLSKRRTVQGEWSTQVEVEAENM